MVSDSLWSTVLEKEIPIQPSKVLAFLSDGEGVNGVAVRKLNSSNVKALSMSCKSHGLNRVLEKHKCSQYISFSSLWIRTVNISSTFCNDFYFATNETAMSYSKNRWASRWECMLQVFNHRDKLL